MILMKAIKVNHPGGEFVLVQKDVPEPQEASVAFDRMVTAKVHFRAALKMGEDSR